MADISFVFDIDGELHQVTAHKLILAAASPVFYKIFYKLNKDYRYIKVSNTNIDAFMQFLQFFYLKKVIITMEHIEEVMKLAKKYRMFECIESCLRYAERKLTVENVCWGYRLAIVLNNDKLRRYCERMISISPLEVFRTDSFLRCDQNVLKNILQIELMLCKETDVLNACLSWARNSCRTNNLDENNPKHLKSQLGECFYLIRFGAMSVEEFVDVLASYRQLFSSKELTDITAMLNPNPRSRPLAHWSRNPELMCWRENSTEDSPYHIQNVESIWFTTNKPLWLNAFWCKGLLHRHSDRVSVNFKLSINEIENPSSDRSDTLFTKMVTIIKRIKTRISIPHPLIICPGRMYEIRLETENSNYYYHCALWDSEVKLDDDLIVSFHKNVSIEHSERRGLVSCLSFKRI